MSLDPEALARLAWAQLWQVTAAALAVGAVVRLCGRHRPRLAYALWMLVIVKAVTPPLWSSPTGLFSWAQVGESEGQLLGSREIPGILAGPPTAAAFAGEAPTVAAGGGERGPISAAGMDRGRAFRLAAFAAWGAGLATCSMLMIGKLIACSLIIRRSRLSADGEHLSALDRLVRRLGVGRRVRLIVTSRPIGPAAFGLLRPSILLPRPLLAGSPPEQVELVLAHELVHIRRGDILASRIQLIAQLIWWFHPLVWWANREAGRAREHCCDEEVVSGIGCKPALYAQTLLGFLERKVRLRSLVAHPGVRALEVTSSRLEFIMRHAQVDHRRASLISRIAFAAGLALLLPGAGPAPRAHSQESEEDGQGAAAAPAKGEGRTISGVIREKGTGRPVAGARVSASADGIGDNSRIYPSTVSDEAGRYTVEGLPKSRKYGLTVIARSGDPYLVTSRIAEATGDDSPLTVNFDLVRGIPFRARVLDRETGKPLDGHLVYYPLRPNNPFDRGVMGYAGVSGVGAFYESSPNDEGQFLGGVLPGPGVLGFSHPFKPGDEFRADRKPDVSYPDGKQNVKLPPADPGGPFGFVPVVASDPIRWTGLPLGQFDAVIAIDPREGAEVATYEIRIAPRKDPK